MKITAQRIKELRTEKGLSMKKLAQLIDTTDASISYWENNINEPTAPNIKALALFFNVSADYLLGLEDDFGNKVTPGKYTIQDSFNNNSGKIDIR